MIVLRHLCKSYGARAALKDVNLTLESGEIVCVVGSSGSGKSTLLRCLSGLEEIDGGSFDLGGAARIGLVFQEFNLFTHLNVLGNVMYALRHVRGLSRRAAMRQSFERLREMGLSQRARARVSELSGGERQRVAIARTLAMQPDVLLLDEPTSALDPQRIVEIAAVITALAQKGLPMLIVTHDLAFARRVATRCVLLQDGRLYDALSSEMRRFLRLSRTLKLTARSRGFDFYGFLGQVQAYCEHSQLLPVRRHALRLVLEELLLNIILPQTPAMTIEIDATSRKLQGGFLLSVHCSSLLEDPFTFANVDWALSARIVAGYCTCSFTQDAATQSSTFHLVSKEHSGHA